MPKAFPKVIVTIGDRIRARRICLKLLQEDVAKIVGVSTMTVTNWENNKSIPMIHFMPAIFKFLGEVPIQMDQTSYAGKVKGLALLLGLGRRNFAKILNVDESTLRAWEQGKNLPTKKRRAEIDFLIDKCLTKQQRVIASSSRGVCA